MAAFSTSNIQTTFVENIEALPRDGIIQHQQQSSYGSPIQTSNTYEGNPAAIPEIIVVTPPPPFKFKEKEKRPNIASPLMNMLITKAVVGKFALISSVIGAFFLGRKKRDSDFHFTNDGSIDSKNIKNTLYKVN